MSTTVLPRSVAAEFELEPRHLRAFMAVADRGSANRAAAALFRAQSAVSRSVKTLERALGAPLFERRARGMLLTEYGRALLVRARRVEEELRQARGDVASAAGRDIAANAPVFVMLAHLRGLRAFVALTEQHHIPSVADGLGITQPAVSAAVKRLEEGIGVRMFERTARGMMPSQAGLMLARRVKRALAEMRHAVADVAALRGVTQGTVHVGALPLGRTRLLPEAIAVTVARYPGLRVATTEGSFETLAAGLRAGELDFILGALRPAHVARDLTGKPLADDELALVARSDHPWVQRRRIAPRDLAQARWVLPRVNTPMRMLFERALAKRGLAPPNVVVETSDLAVLRGILLNSDLVTAISPRQLYYELVTGLLVQIPMPLAGTRRVIGITRRTDSLASPGAKVLMEEIERRSVEVLSAGAPTGVTAARSSPRG